MTIVLVIAAFIAGMYAGAGLVLLAAYLLRQG